MPQDFGKPLNATQQAVNRAIREVKAPSFKILQRAQDLVNSMLGRVGLRLMWTRNILCDLRHVTDNAIHATYLSEGRPFVIDVRLDHCRNLSATAFPCNRTSGNPFIETLMLYEKGECSGFGGSPLEKFYESWQPKNAAAVLGVDVDETSPLRCASPLALTFPWSALGLEDSFAAWKRIIEADNREHSKLLPVGMGWKAWGPVDQSVGNMEFERLVSVYRSIASKGYKRSADWDGDIGGTALACNNEVRILIGAGHHRTAALVALGYPTAPVRFTHAVVRRSDVATWPNVKNGLFPVDQALAVFDRVFSGRQPGAV